MYTQARACAVSPGGPVNTLLISPIFYDQIPGPITSTQLDAVCATNSDFLIRLSGAWQCGGFGSGLTLSGNTVSSTYTPPDTGGVQKTVQAEIQQFGLWANDYGAACNGSGDDHVAFQNAVNAGVTLGVQVQFLGTCNFTSGFTANGAITFGGVNPIASVLTATSGVNIVTINSHFGAILHDFGITYSAATTGDTGIILTAPSSFDNILSRIQNVEILNAYTAISILKGDMFVLKDSYLSVVSGGTPLIVQNTNNGDDGDGVAYGNTIVGNNGVAVQWTTGGGLRFENNKINGISMSIGMQFQLANGLNTSDLFVIGNSIEGFSASGVGIQLLRAGTGNMYHVIIADNEIGGPQVGIEIGTDTAWLNNVNISNNSIQTNAASITIAYEIASPIAGLSIIGGSVLAQGTTNLVFDITSTQTSSNCVLGPVAKNGTFGSSIVGLCQTYAPN